MLNEEQRQRAVAALREYLQAPDALDDDSELDRNRAALIDGQLKPLVQAYLADEIDRHGGWPGTSASEPLSASG